MKSILLSLGHRVLRDRNATVVTLVAGRAAGLCVCACKRVHTGGSALSPRQVPPSLCCSQESESRKARPLPSSVPGHRELPGTATCWALGGLWESMGTICVVCELGLAWSGCALALLESVTCGGWRTQWSPAGPWQAVIRALTAPVRFLLRVGPWTSWTRC